MAVKVDWVEDAAVELGARLPHCEQNLSNSPVWLPQRVQYMIFPPASLTDYVSVCPRVPYIEVLGSKIVHQMSNTGVKTSEREGFLRC